MTLNEATVLSLKVLKQVNNHTKCYLIKNAHINISTSDSKSESFGFSILEALSYGIPSIVFKIETGTNYLIKNNYNGYVVENFDLNLFSKRIKDLYSNPKLYQTIKKNVLLDYSRRLNHNYEMLEKKYRMLLNL